MKERTYLFHGPWEWPPPGGDVDACDVAGLQPRVGLKGDSGRSRGGMDCGTRGGRWGRGVGRRGGGIAKQRRVTFVLWLTFTT
jgi:hypothetical protein